MTEADLVEQAALLMKAARIAREQGLTHMQAVQKSNLSFQDLLIAKYWRFAFQLAAEPKPMYQKIADLLDFAVARRGENPNG